MPWLLPSNIRNEACMMLDKDEQFQLRDRKYHQPNQHYAKSPAAEPLHNSLTWRPSSQLRPQRTKNGTNTKWAIGGPGMQAVFLDSGRRSCGTGVFLPRIAGTTNFHLSNKPACPPVLLPSRVVQALNLNVHELGLQMKPQQECASKQFKGGGIDFCKSLTNKKDYNIDASVGRGGGEESCSPELFLPKEWTY